jgi:hypothetical protein
MMGKFDKQLTAILTATGLIKRMPFDTCWALEVTDEDDLENPSVLNIFVDSFEWDDLAKMLILDSVPVDRDDANGFVSYQEGSLLISFIGIELEEEHND